MQFSAVPIGQFNARIKHARVDARLDEPSCTQLSGPEVPVFSLYVLHLNVTTGQQANAALVEFILHGKSTIKDSSPAEKGSDEPATCA